MKKQENSFDVKSALSKPLIYGLATNFFQKAQKWRCYHQSSKVFQGRN
jgi:hypothetical protein